MPWNILDFLDEANGGALSGAINPQPTSDYPVSPQQTTSPDQRMQQQSRDWNKDTRHGLGKTLGDIADTLLMLDGGKPMFAEANKRERMNEAGKQFASDPQGLARALYGIDFGTGKEYLDSERELQLKRDKAGVDAATAGVTNEQTLLENDKLYRDRAAVALRTAKPEARAMMAEQMNKYLKEKGIDLVIPSDYDEDFINTIGQTTNQYLDTREKHEMNVNTRADRAFDNQINVGRMLVDAIGTDNRKESDNKRDSTTRRGQDIRATTGSTKRAPPVLPKDGDEKVIGGKTYVWKDGRAQIKQ